MPYLVRSQYLWEGWFRVDKTVPTRLTSPPQSEGFTPEKYRVIKLSGAGCGKDTGPRVLDSGCEKWGFRREWEKCKTEIEWL